MPAASDSVATYYITEGPLLCRPTLKWTFGYTESKRTVFLWQTIGAALFTFFPAITYTCQVCKALCSMRYDGVVASIKQEITLVLL